MAGGTARELILDNIKTLLKTIRRDNDYQNDVEFVSRWPHSYEDVQRMGKLPAIIIAAGDERLTSQTLGRTNMPLGHKGPTYHYQFAIGLLVYQNGVTQDVLDSDLEADPIDTTRSTLIEDILKVLQDDKSVGVDASYGVQLNFQSITVSDFIDVPREMPMFGISLLCLHEFRQGEL